MIQVGTKLTRAVQFGTVRTASAAFLLIATAVFGDAAEAKTARDAKRADDDYFGFLIGYGATRVEAGGDFDGNTFVVGGGSAEVMPKLTPATGRLLSLGVQMSGSMFLAASFDIESSDHVGTWQGIDLPTHLDARYLSTRIGGGRHVAGFFLLGYGNQSVTVLGGSTDGTVTADARFKGDTFRVGGGMYVPFHKTVGLLLEGAYRIDSYHQDDGIASGPLGGHTDSNGFTIAAQIRVSIGPSLFKRKSRTVPNSPTPNAGGLQ